MAAAAVQKLRPLDPHPETGTDEALAGLEEVAAQAAQQAVSERRVDNTVTALSTYINDTCNNLDKVTVATTTSLSDLRSEIESVERDVQESGERAKQVIRSHELVSSRAIELRASIVGEVSVLRSDAAKLVSGT